MTDPIREALRQTIEGLAPQIPDWMMMSSIESYGDEDGVGYSIRKETGVDHLRWMLETCLENLGAWPIDRTSRWIGYVQGVLACKSKDFSVTAERARTRPIFHEAYEAAGLRAPATQEST